MWPQTVLVVSCRCQVLKGKGTQKNHKTDWFESPFPNCRITQHMQEEKNIPTSLANLAPLPATQMFSTSLSIITARIGFSDTSFSTVRTITPRPERQGCTRVLLLIDLVVHVCCSRLGEQVSVDLVTQSYCGVRSHLETYFRIVSSDVTLK